MQGAGNVAGQGSDLGAFLANALDTCGRSAPVVFIGTDCVTLTNEAIVIASEDAADGNSNAFFQLLLPFCHHSIFYALVMIVRAHVRTTHSHRSLTQRRRWRKEVWRTEERTSENGQTLQALLTSALPSVCSVNIKSAHAYLSIPLPLCNLSAVYNLYAFAHRWGLRGSWAASRKSS
jgi:hypothetical protein